MMENKKLTQNLEDSKKVLLEIEKVTDDLEHLIAFENESIDFFDQTQKNFSNLLSFQKTAKDLSDFDAIRSDYQHLQHIVFIDIDDFKEKLITKKKQLIQKQDQLYYERQKLLISDQEKAKKVGVKNG